MWFSSEHQQLTGRALRLREADTEMQRHKTLDGRRVLAVLLHLLLDLSLSRTESGSDGPFDEELDLIKLSCFVTFTDNIKNDTITCVLTEPVTDSDRLTVTFSDDMVTRRCIMNLREKSNCSVPAYKFATLSKCCVRVSRGEGGDSEPCILNKKLIHMVKPGIAFNVTVTKLMEAKEFKITWETPRIRYTELTNTLLHQVAYRSADTVSEEHLNVTACSLRLLMKNLIAKSQYTIRIRSAPDQNYFKGMWSDWSQTVYFETPPTEYSFTAGVKVTISFLILLFLFLTGLSVLFWENRIKPHIWPKIPNPKSALEQLYIKPHKAVEVSFNPDSFLDVTESRVDTIQFKGAQLRGSHPSPSSNLTEGSIIATERELLIQADPIREKGAGSTGSRHRRCAETPEGGDAKGGAPEGGDPEGVSAEPSAPLLCLSPGGQLHGSVEAPCHSPGPLTRAPPDGGDGCVQESNVDQGLGGAGATGIGVGRLDSTLSSSPTAPPDESYITMSNLYKIQ
ncbi:LOW QUALITY PROTEIN: interleukin-7 receptor subunit alpha [Heptranchias perlo]|uniref:LOW QUALITY PROTEIN: interleukin-7 receptor subunit alpha n=1 Tax=Heptranchias perlo TaxID=212740 RepID=UPI00355A9E57